ncbi:MAG: hypothetical protein ACE5R4_18790, partial [Armatimonadota bacterium]
WPDTDYHLRAEWRLGMMYYTMEVYRQRLDRKPCARAEDLLAAKRHFEVVVAKWPESTEAPFAGHALQRMEEDLERVVIPIVPPEE